MRFFFTQKWLLYIFLFFPNLKISYLTYLTMVEEIIPNKAKVSFSENGILRIQMETKSNIELADAKIIAATGTRICEDKVHANLVNICKMSFMSGEARKFFAGQDKSLVKAVAIVMNSKFQKAFVNLYMKMSKPLIITRVFTDEMSAESWLLEQLKN